MQDLRTALSAWDDGVGGPVGRPLRLDEVRDLEYLDVGLKEVWHSTGPRNRFGKASPIEPCGRCGRPVRDYTRTEFGDPVEENIANRQLFNRVVLCRVCGAEDQKAALEVEVLELLESKLGLNEKDRDALRSFIETLFTDPAKILQVKDLDNRVRVLEQQTNLLWAAFTGAIISFLIALTALVVSVFGG